MTRRAISAWPYVLEVSQLWKEVVMRIHKDEFPDVELSHMYVDNCAMQIIRWQGRSTRPCLTST